MTAAGASVLDAAVDAVRRRAGRTVDTMICLAPELSGAAAALEADTELPVAEVPHFPEPDPPGSPVAVTVGRWAGRSVLVVVGRFARGDMDALRRAMLPVRLARRLGAERFVAATTAGALDPSCHVGELALITDHINLSGQNPLVGPNLDDMGPRFPDMSEAYDGRLADTVEAAARAEGAVLRRGVLAASPGAGPATPAECRMLRALGADLVVQGFVHEVIVATHCGMRVLGLAALTGASGHEADRARVPRNASEAAARAAPLLAPLIAAALKAEA